MLELNFTPFPVLTTARLNLRRLDPADENEIFAIRSNPEMILYLDRPLYESMEESRRFIKIIDKGIKDNEWGYWAVTLKDNDELIGTICLWQISEEECKAEIGFELRPEYQGKGIMGEAAKAVINFGFKEMKLNIIEGEVDPGNTKSIKLMEKLNFKRINGIRVNDSDAVKSLKTVIYCLNAKNFV